VPKYLLPIQRPRTAKLVKETAGYLVSDIGMPEKDGVSLISELRHGLVRWAEI